MPRNPKMDFDVLRDRMVNEQLVPRSIHDSRVLASFRKVPRHKFVKKEFQASAYSDHPLPVGEGQTISQPYMVALMTECLALTGREKVLEIGTGSGYQAAILAELAKEVITIERIEPLAKNAKEILGELGYTNVRVEVGDGTLGWKASGPYDRIIVTAGAPKIPSKLIEQLAVGGRLVIPVGSSLTQMLTLIEKKKDGLRTTEICGCMFVPLVGKGGWRA